MSPYEFRWMPICLYRSKQVQFGPNSSQMFKTVPDLPKCVRIGQMFQDWSNGMAVGQFLQSPVFNQNSNSQLSSHTFKFVGTYFLLRYPQASSQEPISRCPRPTVYKLFENFLIQCFNIQIKWTSKSMQDT